MLPEHLQNYCTGTEVTEHLFKCINYFNVHSSLFVTLNVCSRSFRVKMAKFRLLLHTAAICAFLASHSPTFGGS